MPYVRRREYNKLEQRYRSLLDVVGFGVKRATEASLRVIDPVKVRAGRELCLFCTYAPQNALKRHVQLHIEALLETGIDVVLIANSPEPEREFEIDAGLRRRLSGLCLRENIGYDFALWAHAYQLWPEQITACTRLLLINDSIVGPLSIEALRALLDRIRRSPAYVVGLTENLQPRRHLQSFFLVFQRDVLRSEALHDFLVDVHSLPTKDLVIDQYETFLTERMARAGYPTAAMFPNLATSPHDSNDTFFRWDQLIAEGFPYIKTSVLEEFWDTPKVRALVPAQFRDGYEFANRAEAHPVA